MFLGACRSITLDISPVEEEATTSLVPPLELVWEQGVGAGFGIEPPRILDDAILVGTRRGEVIALSLWDGERLGAEQFGEVIEGGARDRGTRSHCPHSVGEAGY